LTRLLVFGFLLSSVASAQPASLRGQVTDPSGAVVPGTSVVLTGRGKTHTATSDGVGIYQFQGLAAGAYTIQATSAALSSGTPANLTVKPGVQTFDLRLLVTVTTQRLEVKEDAGHTIAIDPTANASAVVLRGEDLDALADNPDDLQADLQALAGPAAGPNGGSLFVDGFSGGEIPPKESIREIRINQDPFSAEYDKLGYGRIEIFTKPGSNKYHATVNYNFANDFWNSRNPYSAVKAPLTLNEFEGGASGPLGKRASFTIDAQRNTVDNGAIVNAVTLDAQSLTQQPYSAIFTVPQRYTRVTPRIDYQLNTNNTLSLRYGITRGDIDGSGIGSFDLLSRGHHTTFLNQLAQFTETAVLGTAINETRFQYYRYAIQQRALDASPVLQVLGSFTGGGSQLGSSADTQNSYEFQNYTSVLRGAHAFRFGIRLRGQLDDSVSPVNFNGTYTFGGGTAPVLDAANQAVPGQTEQISSIERYRRTLLFQHLGYSAAQIRALGGGATQFSIGAGRPETSVGQFDMGLFWGDTWRVRPNLTLSYGLRYETQTNIHDWRDIAPRLSIAWAPRASARRKTVLRAGFGTFYDRYALANTLTTDRFNGSVQQQYVIANPDTYPAIPSLASLSRSGQIVQLPDASLRAPYILQSAVTFERQLSASTTSAITYTNSHGVHLLWSRDINAPASSPLFLTESTGIYNQNQVIANVNTKVGRNLSLFGFYVFNKAMSDTDGVGASPANPYNYQGEYGPAATDIRNRGTVGGSINTRWNIRLSPFVILQSGAPFNITTGNDVYGTTLFNARPGIATDTSRPGLIQTSYGLLDPSPIPGEKILSRNYGRGPSQFTVNLRLAKTIGIGPLKEGSKSQASAVPTAGESQSAALNGRGLRNLIGAPSAPRRYNLTIGMSMRNLLNHNNPGPIIGNIASPLFGRANQIAGAPNGEGFSENASNRRLEMQLRFTF
jgi:Carboxypeptidase regulatory-like domain